MMKIRKILFLTALLFAMIRPLEAQNVTISGNDPAYAGSELVFYSIDNYFCNSEVKLGECTVAASGSFTAAFPCHNARLIYMYLGVFHVRFFVEPGFSYEVKLPPRTDKSPEEEASPFFERVTVYMNILSIKNSGGREVAAGNELNLLVSRFDEMFNPLYDRLAVDAAMKRPVARLDSTISAFHRGLPRTGNRYFDGYAFYRSGLLYYAAQRNGVKYISNAYFAGKPVLYDNEAYMELFNTTYDKYFMYFGRTGDAIYDVVNVRESFSGLKQLLMQDGVLPADSLCEFVILKNIYDEFYSDRFSRRSLLRLLDSAIVQTKIERHKELAGEIRSKITGLLRGFEPPAFSLYSQDSTRVTMQHYRGKYIYLMFCTTQNYVCLSQYELLEKLYRDHGKWLQIVVVSVDDRLSSMRNFRNRNGYRWDFLHFANDPDILKKYDVRIFPTCYLIDPEGKLALSPAPAANEDLERSLWLELNSKGLWQEYIRKGWMEAPKSTDKRFDLNL
ncbi:MAG: TlpA family protein disulfide reductase [Bacteroidales bacterium]|jgi:peroxiredoxin|nr:TlpA family protein disulfide reductase [Bacteroidales bacterium]